MTHPIYIKNLLDVYLITTMNICNDSWQEIIDFLSYKDQMSVRKSIGKHLFYTEVIVTWDEYHKKRCLVHERYKKC